jgi:hypothetical protein
MSADIVARIADLGARLCLLLSKLGGGGKLDASNQPATSTDSVKVRNLNLSPPPGSLINTPTAADRRANLQAANHAPRPTGTSSQGEAWYRHIGVDGVVGGAVPYG